MFMIEFNITHTVWDKVSYPVALLKAGGTQLFVQALLNQDHIDVINVDSRIHTAEEKCEDICRLLYPNATYNVVEKLTGPIIIDKDWAINTERDLYEYNLQEAYQ